MANPRKRIVIIGPTWPYRGGIAHHTTLLAETLSHRAEVTLISYTRQYPKFLYPGKTDQDSSDYPLKFNNVEFIIDSMSPWTWLNAVRRIRQIAPDEVLVPWWVCFWAPAYWVVLRELRKHGIPISFICHNVMEHESNNLKKGITRAVLSLGNRFLVHAGSEAEKLKDLLGPGREIIRSFHPTYDTLNMNLNILPPELTQLAEKNDRVVLLFFGFVRPYKGLKILIDAFAELKKKQIRNLQLLIVGEFWKDKMEYVDRIKALGLDSSSVIIVDRYVGNEEISAFFRVSDLVVLPYISATGSGICQLAYGAGKPVVASRVGSFGEVIEDGVNGALFPAGNRVALVDALLRSMARLPELTHKAHETGSFFSWERYVDPFANLQS